MLYSVVLERASHDGWLGICGMTLLAATGEIRSTPGPTFGKVISSEFFSRYFGRNKNEEVKWFFDVLDLEKEWVEKSNFGEFDAVRMHRWDLRVVVGQ